MSLMLISELTWLLFKVEDAIFFWLRFFIKYPCYKWCMGCRFINFFVKCWNSWLWKHNVKYWNLVSIKREVALSKMMSTSHWKGSGYSLLFFLPQVPHFIQHCDFCMLVEMLDVNIPKICEERKIVLKNHVKRQYPYFIQQWLKNGRIECWIGLSSAFRPSSCFSCYNNPSHFLYVRTYPSWIATLPKWYWWIVTRGPVYCSHATRWSWKNGKVTRKIPISSNWFHSLTVSLLFLQGS